MLYSAKSNDWLIDYEVEVKSSTVDLRLNGDSVTVLLNVVITGCNVPCALQTNLEISNEADFT